jgi:hypothetical protein
MSRSFGSRVAFQATIFGSVSVEDGMPKLTLAALESNLAAHGRPLASFKKGDRVRGATGMALKSGYSYVLEAAPGELPAEFQPDLTPGEILMLGAFEGRYLNDCVREFPAEWFVGALAFGNLSPEGADPERCNLFGIKSRQSLMVWDENGWSPSWARAGRKDDHYHGMLGDPATNPDERGWFQWYCRYWMGRRMPALDDIQIKRWRSFRRHAGAIRANCPRGNLTCRARERQALLQWAYNPFI